MSYATTLLSVENITKKIAEKAILSGVSFSVEKGEIFGCIGLNGAGKTTTVKCVLDLIRPDSGKIALF